MTSTSDGAAANYTEPSTAADERTKEGFVRVIVAIKGLRTTGEFVKGTGLLPITRKKVAENAKVVDKFENRSFSLTVDEGRGELKNRAYRLHIRRLPADIKPEESYTKLERDRILVFLCKREDKSWYPELESGLETAEDEDEETGATQSTGGETMEVDEHSPT